MRTILTGIVVLALGSGCFMAAAEPPLIIGSFDAGRGDGGADAGSVSDAGRPRRDGGSGFDDGGSFDAPASAFACAAGEWCWQHPLPQGQPLNVVYAVSETEAWALGDRGAMMRWLFGVWTALPSPTNLSFSHIWGSGPSDVWAIARKPSGQGSKLFHFDGATWEVVPHGSLVNVSEVTGSATGDVWVLTTSDTTLLSPELLRWNGTALVAAPALPTGVAAKSVCVRSANEVWVTVNDALNSFPIALYRWDGAVWTLIHRETQGSGRRFDSRVTCPADGVAVVKVFDFDTGTHSLLEARGTQVSWGDDLGGNSLIATSSGVFTVTIDGRSVFQWSPTGWRSRFLLPSGQSQYSVGFDFAGNVGWLANGTPTLSTWDGTDFVPSQPTVGHLNAFAAPASQDPTAVFGEGTWGRRTGSSWVFAATPTLSTGAPLRVTRASSMPNGDAWLIGSGIARYDAAAQTITPVVTLTDGEFTAIDRADDGTTWVVGAQVLRYVGGQWQAPPVAPPTVVDGLNLSSLTFTAVDVRSENDVMLLGNDPAGGRFVSVFYRWDGAAWTAQLTAGPTLSLFDRDSVGDLYVVEQSEIKKRAPAATTWTTVGTIDGYAARLQVWGPDELEVVVRSEAGMGLYEWDDTRGAFTLQQRGLGVDGVTDIVHGGGGTYWAMGTYGSVLRLAP